MNDNAEIVKDKVFRNRLERGHHIKCPHVVTVRRIRNTKQSISMQRVITRIRIRTWCSEHCSGLWNDQATEHKYDADVINVVFENDSDAVMFKLSWET